MFYYKSRMWIILEQFIEITKHRKKEDTRLPFILLLCLLPLLQEQYFLSIPYILFEVRRN
jgi:hypothetical protein